MSKRKFWFWDGPARGWRALMRVRLRAAMKAIRLASQGCAYNPEYGEGRLDEAFCLIMAELESCHESRWRTKGGAA